VRIAKEVDIRRPLFVSAFVIATCGLVYELIAGAMASYLLGDSVTQFSLIIGIYLSAMGVGAYLSKFIDRHLLTRFVEIELAVAVIGGFEALILSAAFAYTDSFRVVLFTLVSIIGMLVGMELPLLIRILETRDSLKDLVARVFFLDYIGALLASLSFPLLLLPHVGMLRSALIFGALNALVALWTTQLFAGKRAIALRLRILCCLVLAALGVAYAFAGSVEARIDADLFADPVVMSKRSPYQRLTITRRDGDTRLFINGALQFSSIDEYRYHEALVHPAMSLSKSPERILVLGGGDGMAVRETLKWPSVNSITLIDLDPMMTEMFTDHPELSALNAYALTDSRVETINADAFHWVRTYEGEPFDVVIIDFPDPNNFSLGKLYSNLFYRMLMPVMSESGVLAVQSTSPIYSPRAFWCIAETIGHEGFQTQPYHAYVPAFGEWGFVLATKKDPGVHRRLPEGLRFLDDESLSLLFVFPVDLQKKEVPINRMDNQALVRLYEEDWRSMGRDR